MEAWGASSKNAVIFTEPDYEHLHALAPYQPLGMKVSWGDGGEVRVVMEVFLYAGFLLPY